MSQHYNYPVGGASFPLQQPQPVVKKQKTSTTNSNLVTLKLLIDKKTSRVLFAEAGKDFVDFLFTLLTVPLGSVISLLSTGDNNNNKGGGGCLANVQKSIEDLGDTFIRPPTKTTQDSAALKLNSAYTYVQQQQQSVSLQQVQQLQVQQQQMRMQQSSTVPVVNTKCPSVYSCMNSSNDPNNTTTVYHPYYGVSTDGPRLICPACTSRMNRAVAFAKGMSGEECGFVKDHVIYLVTDSLEVKPMSAISSIALLNELKVEGLGDLQEKVVHLGVEEGLKLQRACLQSKTVLTDVFLIKNEEPN